MSERAGNTFSDLISRRVLSIGDGYRTRRDQLSDSGYRILRVADINGGRISASGPDFVDESYKNAIGAKAAKKDDVVLTTKGTVGRVAVVPTVIDPIAYSPQICYFRIEDQSTVVPRYLAYWLQSTEFTMQSSHLQGNTDMAPYISLRDLRSTRISLPSLGQQMAVAEVLSALDEKIDSNRNLHSGLLDVARATWAWKAVGAETSPLSQIVAPGLSGVWGDDYASSSSTESVFVLRGRDLQDYTAGVSPNPPLRWISSGQAAKRISNLKSEIWTAGSGSLGPSLLITPSVRQGFDRPILYSNFVRRLISIDGQEVHMTSAWYAMLSAWDAGSFENFRTGTAMPNLNVSALLDGVRVPLLTRADIGLIQELAHMATSPELVDENVALAALRDTLLPPLMSGKLRVRDAERAVSEVL